jgi:hypothetical protein
VTPRPTFNPAANSSVPASQRISIADSTPGATIYWVSGPVGTKPTISSTVYAAPISFGSLGTYSPFGGGCPVGDP